jgi:predicted transcriptional regulator
MLSSERTQVSMRVPNKILAELDRIATALERDRSWVMLRAFKLFLEGEGSVILDEAEGLAELDRGESFDLDDVLAEAEALIAAHDTKTARKAG